MVDTHIHIYTHIRRKPRFMAFAVYVGVSVYVGVYQKFVGTPSMVKACVATIDSIYGYNWFYKWLQLSLVAASL